MLKDVQSDEKIDSYHKQQINNSSLSCPRVWSVLFKLHRLHQQLQKVHDISSQVISVGLKILRESLVNFKIDETPCDNLYVYTRNSEIYLLTLEEVYENQSSNNNNAFTEDTLSAEDTVVKNLRLNNLLSRRSSHTSHVNMVEILEERKMATNKTQNLSGEGSIANNNSSNNILGTTGVPAAHRTSPDYIRLNLFGLQDPDEEMKHFLCKILQSELDYWLLIKMCKSIEMNTYKTTSAQHPDKITDEDLQFFKTICENYFDYEIPLPFVFNFNKVLRENFFYFVKQIFNANFKSIDPTPSNLNSTFLSDSVGKESSGKTVTPSDEYDELNNLIVKEEFYRQSLSAKPLFQSPATSYDVSSKRHTQVFTTGNTINLKRNDSDINNNILLTRIFFHNANSTRFGRHGVSLVLVEALYSLKGIKIGLLSSKITRSNSMGGSNSVKPPQQTNEVNQPLEGKGGSVYSQTRKSGPAFIFRFYCRGENDINLYKASLKSALNDALLCFFSEYLTRIDPELYLKRIKLKTSPAIFRLSECSVDLDEGCKSRKRHKSTGNDNSSASDDSKRFFWLT